MLKVLKFFRELRARQRFMKNAVIGENFICGVNTGIYKKRIEKDAIKIGKNVSLLGAELRCYEHGSIEIDDYSWFSLRTQIISCSSVKIGKYCIFASFRIKILIKYVRSKIFSKIFFSNEKKLNWLLRNQIDEKFFKEIIWKG